MLPRVLAVQTHTVPPSWTRKRQCKCELKWPYWWLDTVRLLMYQSDIEVTSRDLTIPERREVSGESRVTLTLPTPCSLQWRHNGRDSVSNHQPYHCLLNRLFRGRSKKTSKLRVTGLCVGNSPVTGEFPAQKAGNAENVFIWRRHHVITEHQLYCSVKWLHQYSIPKEQRFFQHVIPLSIHCARFNKCVKH